MAGIWADFPSGSHGLYGADSSAMNDGVWTDIGGVGQIAASILDDPDPAIGSAGKVLGGTGSNSYGKRYILPSAQTKVGLGLNLWLTSLPNGSGDTPIPTEWRDGGNNRIGYVYITTTGQVAFFNRYDNAMIAISDGPVVTANSWPHIESALTCSDSGAAEIEVRVRGVTKLTHSGFTTGVSTGSGAVTASAQLVVNQQRSASGAAHSRWKNLTVWDGSGTEANDFQGSVSVFWRPIVTDVTTGGWTLSSGSNMSALIGVVGPPNDANYIAADDTPPAAARAVLQNLPPDMTSVRFIVPAVRGAKVDGGDGNLQLALSPNGTNYDTGPDTPITTAFTYWPNATAPFVSHLNPATAAPWTPADFNAGVELQINRTL